MKNLPIVRAAPAPAAVKTDRRRSASASLQPPAVANSLADRSTVRPVQAVDEILPACDQRQAEENDSKHALDEAAGRFSQRLSAQDADKNRERKDAAYDRYPHNVISGSLAKVGLSLTVSQPFAVLTKWMW